MSTFGELDDPPLKNLFDCATGAGFGGGAIRLTAGAPGPDLLKRCLPLFQAATKHRLEKEQDEANIFQYGASSGSWEFREQLSKFLTDHYQDPVSRADLILTCGATHGLQVVIASLLAPGAVIFVEEATYMIALDMFKEYPNLPLVSVAIDEGGIIISDFQIKLEEKIRNGEWQVTKEKPFWAMLYCIPVFHNPTGVTLKQDRCEALVSLARQFNFLVFCDDVYNLLAHRAEPPPRRLFTFDRPGTSQYGGHVVSNGSFSKILAPGVRVGWLEAPPRIVGKLRSSGLLRSSGAVNQYMSGVVTSLLELGLQRDHLRFLANTLEGRMVAVIKILETRLPPGCRFQHPKGGYYLWLELPAGTNAAAFSSWSEHHHGVTALPGAMFASKAGAQTNCLRLAVAFHPQPTLETATVRLCEALHAYLTLPKIDDA